MRKFFFSLFFFTFLLFLLLPTRRLETDCSNSMVTLIVADYLGFITK
jgi:hypothetical protein